MSNLTDYTIPLSTGRFDVEDDPSIRRRPIRSNIQSGFTRNQSLGYRLGSVRDYSYGLSNPALRPIVPKGC